MSRRLYAKDGTQIRVGMIIKILRPIKVGRATKHRTETATVRAIYHGPVGRVLLRWEDDGSDGEYFPSYIDAEWREE